MLSIHVSEFEAFAEKTTVANGMGLTGDANERGWKMGLRWRLEMEA